MYIRINDFQSMLLHNLIQTGRYNPTNSIMKYATKKYNFPQFADTQKTTFSILTHLARGYIYSQLSRSKQLGGSIPVLWQ